MNIEEIKEEILILKKEIQTNWWKLINLKKKNNNLKKEDVIKFKYELLLPVLDKVKDVSIISIERNKTALYPTIINFYKNITDLSTYYTRQDNIHMDFNYSQESEVLSCLLPGYESAVNMLIIGAVAVTEGDFDFISKLGNENIPWVKTVDGNTIYKSIYYYPWFESGWGAGSLITYFDDALNRLSNDKLLKERYFNITISAPLKYLCQYNFLQALKIESLKQNDWGEGFPFFPNFARFRFSYINELISEIINKPSKITDSFNIEENVFKQFLKAYIDYTTKNFNITTIPWLDYLSKQLKEYIES